MLVYQIESYNLELRDLCLCALDTNSSEVLL